MNKPLKIAKLDEVGAIEKPLIDGPVALAELRFDESGGYYEIPLIDANRNAVCFVPCPDGSEASEAWRAAHARAEAIRDAINARME